MPSPHDDYIAQAPAFAVPILKKLRKAVLAACPDAEETIKWRQAIFEHHGILAGMSAHKAHVNFGFWRGKELADPEGILEIVGKTQIGNVRLETPADVPPQRVLVKYVKAAMSLNEAGTRPTARKKPSAGRTIAAPPDLLAALKREKKARETFDGFSYSARKEYVEWITEARRDETRAKRVAQAVEWLAEGKPRNWKYMPEWR